jgi:hypothetical protein
MGPSIRIDKGCSTSRVNMDKKGMMFFNFEVGNRDKLGHHGYDRGHLESWSEYFSKGTMSQGF